MGQTEYQLDISGLADAVASAQPELRHRALLARMAQFDPLAGLKLAATRGDSWLQRRTVIDAGGREVATDHEQWLAKQLATDGGVARRTYERLKDSGFLLSKAHLTELYLVAPGRSGEPADFVQARVFMQDEWTDRPLFTPWPHVSIRDLRDLLELAGPELDAGKRTRVGSPSYRLRSVEHVAPFVAAANAIERVRQDSFRRRTVLVTVQGLPTRELTTNEAFSGWDAAPLKWGRLFNDWTRSSAGRAGAALHDHWVMQLQDHTDAQGERWMSYVPAWTTTLKLAKVDASKGSDYELFGKLEKLNDRLKLPFAWFFFMLHGNRVTDGAGHRIIRAAESGRVVLPEHDYRVLKDWQAHPYGF